MKRKTIIGAGLALACMLGGCQRDLAREAGALQALSQWDNAVAADAAIGVAARGNPEAAAALGIQRVGATGVESMREDHATFRELLVKLTGGQNAD